MNCFSLYSIAIPLEQGLRQINNVDCAASRAFYRYSIRTRIKTVLEVDVLAEVLKFYRYSIRTRIKTTFLLQSPTCGLDSIVIPLEQGFRHIELVATKAITIVEKFRAVQLKN